MTELQQKELELLKLTVDICDRLGLRYYLLCGSALGAVKYKGFIPWDDDIDLGLLRPDYELFCREAQRLLPEHIFLQNYKTDSAFAAIYSKLRNSETTYIEESASKLPINHGIFIDIFPLDGYPVKTSEKRFLEIRKTIYKRLLSVSYLPNRKWKWLFIGPLRLLGFHRRSSKIAQKYEKMVTRYSVTDTEVIANHGNWQGRLDYSPVDELGDGADAVFEDIKVLVPADFDTYLRRKYGDYTEDPPLSEQVGHHYYTELDCHKSYREKTQ